MKARYFIAFLLLVAGLQQAKAQEAYAVYTSDNTTLTFYYDNQRSSHSGQTYDMNTGETQPGWKGIGADVTEVVFDASFANARPTSAYYWFYGMKKLQSITGLSNLNTSEVTSMAYMFRSCGKLTSLDLSSFNTSNVTSMHAMFSSCNGLKTTLDLSSFNTTNVTDMQEMFYWCGSLPRINVSSFNTSNVTNMMGMFHNCYKLDSLDLSSFNTAEVTDMQEMFCECRVLSRLDLSSFNTKKVTNMRSMFDNCSSLATIYVGKDWSTEALEMSFYNMFMGCRWLVGSAGTTYDSGHTDAAYAHIDGGPSNPGYLSQKRGDVNLDGTVDIADVTAVLTAMANGSHDPQYRVNDDEVVDIADVTAILTIMAGQ